MPDAPLSTPPSSSDTTVTLTADDRRDLAFALSGQFGGRQCPCEACETLVKLIERLCAAPAAEVAS